MNGLTTSLVIGSATLIPGVGGYAYINNGFTEESLSHITLENPQDIRNKYQEISCINYQFKEIIGTDIELDPPKPSEEQLRKVGEIDMDGCLATGGHKDLYKLENKWRAKVNTVVTLKKDTRGFMFVSQITANNGKFTTEVAKYALKQEEGQGFAFKERDEDREYQEFEFKDVCLDGECQGEKESSSQTGTKEIELTNVSYDKLENLNDDSSKHIKEKIIEVEEYIAKAMCNLVNEHKYNLSYIIRRYNGLASKQPTSNDE